MSAVLCMGNPQTKGIVLDREDEPAVDENLNTLSYKYHVWWEQGLVTLTPPGLGRSTSRREPSSVAK
jgi:hypothetical protein